MIKLVLLRHGESEWNLANRFTGWTDVGLSEKGVKSSQHMKLAGISDEGRTRVVNTALEVLRQHLITAGDIETG